MLIRLKPKGKQSVASFLNRGTRTPKTAGVKAGTTSSTLLERNTVNPISRLFEGRSGCKADWGDAGQTDRWSKPKPFGNRTDRGWNITPPRKRADFQQVVRYESAGRTFEGGNRK